MNNYKIDGKIVKGFGFATDTIEKQKSFFKDLPNLDKLYSGTINIDIFPFFIKPVIFDYFYKDVCWGEDFYESFDLCKVKIFYEGKEYDGYIYFAHESRHFKGRYFFNYLEILAEKIPIKSENKFITIEINKENIDVYKKL